MPRRELRVFVYRNLHADCFSVRDLATGRVVAHADSVQVRDAVFRVNEGGRRRVLREGRRNVHAGVVGTLVIDPRGMSLGGAAPGREVSYNPFRGPDFTDRDGKPVRTAKVAWLRDGKVFV